MITIKLTIKGKTLLHNSIESLTTLFGALEQQLDTNQLDAIRQLQDYHCQISGIPAQIVGKFN
ncbi:MAG: hypothetical protein HC773_22875 [Scytonema sp. CRU_2_7]|nr:hypothetical protein [Scytonema sp. CRU_2_7]